ncbi:MAG: hypothetical protein ACJ8AT_35830, partial [Hyalangium sp.]
MFWDPSNRLPPPPPPPPPPAPKPPPAKNTPQPQTEVSKRDGFDGTTKTNTLTGVATLRDPGVGGPSKPAPGSPAARAQKYEAQVREHIAALSPQPPIPPTAPSVVAGHIADIIKKVPPELRAQVVHDVQ